MKIIFQRLTDITFTYVIFIAALNIFCNLEKLFWSKKKEKNQLMTLVWFDYFSLCYDKDTYLCARNQSNKEVQTKQAGNKYLSVSANQRELITQSSYDCFGASKLEQKYMLLVYPSEDNYMKHGLTHHHIIVMGICIYYIEKYKCNFANQC